MSLFLSPQGVLHFQSCEVLDPRIAAELKEIAKEGSADILIFLATRHIEVSLPPVETFWRGFARRFFTTLCHTDDPLALGGIPAPGLGELEEVAGGAPQMVGAEYLNGVRLEALWRELDERVFSLMREAPDGAQAWCGVSRFSCASSNSAIIPRNGSILDLQISPGAISALVMGSSLYKIGFSISPLPGSKWKTLKERCAGQIDSLVELLQGRFSDAVMRVITDHKSGLFPAPSEIQKSCSCPDWAGLCKHLAAVRALKEMRGRRVVKRAAERAKPQRRQGRDTGGRKNA